MAMFVESLDQTSELSTNDPVYVDVKKAFDNARLSLVRILRINNTQLLERFNVECDQLKKMKSNNKDFQLNIENLFHGSTAPLNLICDEGLDERLSRTGRFGNGIYFSDNPKKCCQYVDTGPGCYILRCRVILGDIKEYAPGEADRTLKREPEMCIVDGKRVYYDSVKGSPSDHTEYVIYDKRRALIEYIIFFASSKIKTSTKNKIQIPKQVIESRSQDRSPPGSPDGSPSGSPNRSPPGSPDGSPSGSPDGSPYRGQSPRSSGSSQRSAEVNDDDDPVSVVMKNLIEEFKSLTCCDNENVCRSYLEKFKMNVNDAVNDYFENM